MVIAITSSEKSHLASGGNNFEYLLMIIVVDKTPFYNFTTRYITIKYWNTTDGMLSIIEWAHLDRISGSDVLNLCGADTGIF